MSSLNYQTSASSSPRQVLPNICFQNHYQYHDLCIHQNLSVKFVLKINIMNLRVMSAYHSSLASFSRLVFKITSNIVLTVFIKVYPNRLKKILVFIKIANFRILSKCHSALARSPCQGCQSASSSGGNIDQKI